MKQLIKLPDYYKNLPTEPKCYLVTLTLENGGNVQMTIEINWPKFNPRMIHKFLKQLAKNDENTIAIENIDNESSLIYFLSVTAALYVYPQLLALNEDYFYLPDEDFFKAEPWESTHSFTLLEAYLKTFVVKADCEVTSHTIPF